MATGARKPVDDVLDVALRQTLAGLGFKSRGKRARYFELPCDGFKWWVGFGPGPRAVKDEAFTDAISIYVPELDRILTEIGIPGARRPRRVNHRGHYFGSIEGITDETASDRLHEWAESNFYAKSVEKLLLALGFSPDDENIEENKTLMLFGRFLGLFVRFPKDTSRNWLEKEIPFYYGFFEKEKPLLRKAKFYGSGYSYGEGHYWDTRGGNIQEIGETIDSLWRQYCWPFIENKRDFKAMADYFFPISADIFGSGPSMASVIVQHIVGNKEEAAELLRKINAEGKLMMADMLEAYRLEFGEKKHQVMVNSKANRELLARQLIARYDKIPIAVKLAKHLGIALE